MHHDAQKVKDKLRNIANKKKVDFNVVMRFYMYDRFIERLSKSKYKDNFIIKGGFYLSNLFGIDNRSTMDIDTAIRNSFFTEENLLDMIKDILTIDTFDSVHFEIEKTEPIREENLYGGLRVTILFSLENIKDKFHIDLATGDSIYPGPIHYKYESLIDDAIYPIWCYNLETVLAEKLETIFSKLETSSRMKDYYDIYLIYNLKFDKLNKLELKEAILRTFNNRMFLGNLKDDLKIIRESKVLREKWLYYKRKNRYANKIEFGDTIDCLEKIINLL